MATRESYVHNSMADFFFFFFFWGGHPEIVSFRQEDSQPELLEFLQLYKQNSEKFFIFTIYQNYTLASMRKETHPYVIDLV